jgi:hypothetical protein
MIIMSNDVYAYRGENSHGQLGAGTNEDYGRVPGEMSQLPYLVFSDSFEAVQLAAYQEISAF